MIIETIDCDYMLPRYAASFLLIHEGKAAFIENNTTHAIPNMLDCLAANGLSPTDVEYCVITHVHLDHAGGSSALMQACPNATLLAHPRAARHVIDPSKLIASAQAVYGAEQFATLYGQINPIEAHRVQSVDDGETLLLGDLALEFLHTRGHANHHFVVNIPSESVIFTGDAFGIVYPDLSTPSGSFAFPSTSPTDFDAALASEAVERIVKTGAKTAYLTHFGPTQDLHDIATQLKSFLKTSQSLLEQAFASDLADDKLYEMIKPALRQCFEAQLQIHQIPINEATWNRLAVDLDLNAQGLAFAAAKRRRKLSPTPER